MTDFSRSVSISPPKAIQHIASSSPSSIGCRNPSHPIFVGGSIFNILPTHCFDAVLIKIQSNGKHSFHHVVAARVRSNGALELMLAPEFIAGARSADVTTAMLMPEQWTMEHFHHIYHFRRLPDPNIKLTDTFITAYILSPRP